jgi:hypothetical protein
MSHQSITREYQLAGIAIFDMNVLGMGVPDMIFGKVCSGIISIAKKPGRSRWEHVNPFKELSHEDHLMCSFMMGIIYSAYVVQTVQHFDPGCLEMLEHFYA